MDALQLPCSHQLMRNNGCRTLTLQTVLPTPDTQTRNCQRKIKCARGSDIITAVSSELHTQNNCEYSIKIGFPVSPLSFEGHLVQLCNACAELVWGRNLLRSLLNLPLAADGWECCFGVELQSFFQGLPDLLRVCQCTGKQHHEIIPSCTAYTLKPEQRCRQSPRTPGPNKRAGRDATHLFRKASAAATLCRLIDCPPHPPVADLDRPTRTWHWPHSGWSPLFRCPGPLSPA